MSTASEKRVERLQPDVRVESSSANRAREATRELRPKKGKRAATKSRTSKPRSSRSLSASVASESTSRPERRRTSKNSSSSASQPSRRADENDEEKGASVTSSVKKGIFSVLSRAKAAASTAVKAVKSAAGVGESTVDFDSCSVVVDSVAFAEGGFSQVYRARLLEDENVVFALKWMIVQDRAQYQNAMQEIEVHRKVGDHPNILRLNDVLVRSSLKAKTHNAKDVLMLFPLCEHGSLMGLIERGATGAVDEWPLPQPYALRLFEQVCLAVQYMHKRGMAHRDIKPHNVLLFPDEREPRLFKAVLMDLGSVRPVETFISSRKQAIELQDECDTHCTPTYRAPELHDVRTDTKIDGRADIFSLGALLYAMAFGHNPFEHPNRGFEKLGLMNGNVRFPEGGINMAGCAFTSEFCKFTSSMLRGEASRRLKLSKVLKTLNAWKHRDRD